jgi:hypothetical protein
MIEGGDYAVRFSLAFRKVLEIYVSPQTMGFLHRFFGPNLPVPSEYAEIDVLLSFKSCVHRARNLFRVPAPELLSAGEKPYFKVVREPGQPE